MSTENKKDTEKSVQLNGKKLIKFLQNREDGATVEDMVQHLRAEDRSTGSQREEYHNSVEKLLEDVVAAGFLSKNGPNYHTWKSIKRKGDSKRGRPSKTPKRDVDFSDDDTMTMSSGRSSHRSDNKGERKRRSDKNGEDGDRRRRGNKKEPEQSPRSDEEGETTRQARRPRQRPRPAKPAT